MDKDVENYIRFIVMNKIEKILKARKKMKVLMMKQDKVFQKLLKDLNADEIHNPVLADQVFDYLYNGTSHSLTSVKKELQKNSKTSSWWHR